MATAEPHGARYWAQLRPVWRSISIHDCPEEFLRRFHAVPPVAGHLFAAHWCQSEVCNGGLHQFFSNPTGVLAPEALEAFRAIGLSEWAEVLAEAMRFFGSPYPRRHAERQAMLPYPQSRKRVEWDPFYGLDERFYAWLRAGRHRWEKAADRFAAEQGAAPDPDPDPDGTECGTK